MKPLRVLIVEDSRDDVALLLRALRKGGLDPVYQQVEDPASLRAALKSESWELVISDHVMPGFDSYVALRIVNEESPDLPFIVVSGKVGEEEAVKVMKAGANDYLIKDNLIRLVPAIERELGDAETRRQKRLAEEQLRQAQKMEALGQLTGGIAHDFNNLLGVIIGNAELLADEIGAQNPSIEEILAAASRSADLTQRLLAFSRKQPLRPKALHLGDIASNMTDLLRRSLGEGIAINIVNAPDLWFADADEGQVANTILNLAINARDAMSGDGDLIIETKNVVLSQADAAVHDGVLPGEYVALVATDTGAGMSSDVMEHAFEPFFTTKGVGEGSGLGLSMVYGFAKQSNGHVSIDSEQGKGTTVTVYLPRSMETPATKKTVVPMRVASGNGETILVVEDDAGLRQLIARVLERQGYQVQTARNGQSARAILEETPKMDLLLTDMVLPDGLSGTDIALEATNRNSNLKVMFMSGYSEERSALDRWPRENADMLQKPFRKDALILRVRSVLDREDGSAPGRDKDKAGKTGSGVGG